MCKNNESVTDSVEEQWTAVKNTCSEISEIHLAELCTLWIEWITDET